MEGQDNIQKKFFSRASFFRCLTMSLTSALLFCSLPLFPPLGTTAFLFSPTPLALLGARENKGWMALGLLGSSAFLFLMYFFFDVSAEPWFFLYFVLIEGFLCFGLTLPLGKLQNGGESLLFCTVASIVAKTLLLALTVTLTGRNPFSADPNALRTLLAQAYSDVLSEGGQQAMLLEESVEKMATFVPYMAPSLIFLSALFDSFINYRLCETLQRKRDVKFPALPSFAEWRFPQSLLWALAVSFVLPFLTEGETWPLWTMLEFNLKFLVLVFFFLQGISLVWWWLSRIRVHVVLRVLIVVLLVLPVLGLWVVALGVGDILVDFRTKKAAA